MPGWPIKSATFRLAALGAVLLWAALPPADLWPLAWLAPVPWIALIRRRELDGLRPYAKLTLVGFFFWLAALYWLTLPYWAVAFGWIALAFYFAFYLTLFIGLARVAVHRLRVPVILAAPLIWTGLELVRAHLLGGLTMASLGHTQYRWLGLIQIADLAGAYGVSFLVMFVAACLGRMLPCDVALKGTVPFSPTRKLGQSPLWPLAPAALLMAAVLVYGHARIGGGSGDPGPRVALIQGSIDTSFGENLDIRERIFAHYKELTERAVNENQDLDLIVWPETFFAVPLVICDADAGTHDPEAAAAGVSAAEAQRCVKEYVWKQRAEFEKATQDLHLPCPMLVGLDTQHYTAEGGRIYNSAAYVSAAGDVLGRYDKMHLVMFGEYIPLAEYIPWLYNMTPLSMGITPGTEPKVFELQGKQCPQGVRLAPDICYESVLPHVIRGQLNAVRANGLEPDVLVNLTNSGWYWGSNELDMHLACNVFRAVECRKPLLVAANTGFSAWIDGDGQILAKGPRRAPEIIVANVRLDGRSSWYRNHGDWLAGMCLAFCVLLALHSTLLRKYSR